jgi:hypothetical protein
MNFKIQVVYEAGLESRFKKIAPRLTVGKLVFISGFFDLNDDETLFVEAKEIDILDDPAINMFQNQSSIDFQSPFSRAQKFRKNKNKSSEKKLLTSTNKEVKINNNDEKIQEINDINEEELEIASTSTSESISEKQKKNNNKRKKELADLSLQRLEKASKKTKVKTRSQKQKEKLDQIDPTEENDQNSA